MAEPRRRDPGMQQWTGDWDGHKSDQEPSRSPQRKSSSLQRKELFVCSIDFFFFQVGKLCLLYNVIQNGIILSEMTKYLFDLPE